MKYRSYWYEFGRPSGYNDFDNLQDAKLDFEKSKIATDVIVAYIFTVDDMGFVVQKIEEYIK
jgi:hypothetical protein